VVALTSVVTTPRVDELPFNGLANGELEESKEAKLSSTANGETK
jgi:hypothetical protein